MKLNIYSGRTYNDVNQHHVFPWVICDYTSQDLDFNNIKKTYRNLELPIGALNPERLKGFYVNFYKLLIF